MNIIDKEPNTKVTIKIEPPEQKVCNVIETTCTNLCENIKVELVENEVPVFYEDETLRDKFETQSKNTKSCVNTMKRVSENSNRKLKITKKTTDTDNKMSKIGQSFSTKDINIKKTMKSDLFYYCEICKMKCLSEKSLQAHMRLHDESRNFKCITCGCRYKSNAELVKHMTTHSQTKYECETCGYESKWKYNFDRHMKQKHGEIVLHDKNTNITNNDIPGSSQQILLNIDNSQSQNKDDGNTLYHYCNICDFKSFVKHTLEKHMKIHDLSRKYPCDVCLYRFSTRADLRKHMPKHSNKKFSCRVCGRQYKHEPDVTTHMHVHEGVQYRCDMCGHVCDSKSQLSKHMSTKHNNSYKCNVCLKMFTDNRYYNNHMKTHLKSMSEPNVNSKV